MKITLITQYLEGHGGTERVISELVNHDLKNTYLILVPASGKPDWLQWLTRRNGYQVKICSQKDQAAQRNFVIKNVLVEKPDITLCLEGKATKLASQIREKSHLKFKIISWGHTSIKESNNFVKNDLDLADAHLAISSGIKQQLINFGVNKKKIFLVYNPIKIVADNIINPPKKDAPFHGIYIGRMLLDGQKNLTMLLQVLAKLKFPWQIDIFGQGKDENAIKNLAQKEGIATHINWQGWLLDPWSKIKEADCLLLCSTYEGFPMVVIEAIAHGLPVISTDCPTGPADIINSQNGILTPVNDQSAFAQACKNMYNARGKYNRIQIKQSVKKFNLPHYINQLQQIYAQVKAL